MHGGGCRTPLTAATLQAGVQECKGCELYQDATQGVAGSGPLEATLMVVGEQPGAQEDEAGRPFVGPAGTLLDRVLEEAGVDPASVYRTNVVKHFRWSASRGKQRIHKSPSRVHVAACGPWLVSELQLVRPTGVVLLGATAGQAVFGSRFRVGEARGTLHAWPADFPSGGLDVPSPEWVLPTVHPSAVLRSRQREQDREAMIRDLRVAAQALVDT